jgi:hypothetical protein
MDEVVAFSLDYPRAGTINFDGTLRLAGWVIGRDRPVERLLAQWSDRSAPIPVKAERPDVATVMGEHLPNMPRVGFDQRLRVLPPDARAGELTLRVALEGPDGGLMLAEVDLYSDVNPRWPAPRLSPLVATGLGRSGTTLLMRALSACPAVVVAGGYPYEAEFGVHVARAAHEALDLRRVRELPRELAEFVAGSFVERTRAHFADVLDAFYGAALRSGGGGNATATAASGTGAAREPRYFAEKGLPEDGAHFASLYGPLVKEIFLVRDFRDMVASVLAINASRGYHDFTRERYASDVEYVRGVAAVVERLRRAWSDRGERALLVRYEELVTDLPAALRRVYRYLEADVPERRLAGIVAACTAGEGIGRGHVTSPSPRESLGRWRRDLAPEVREVAAESLGPALQFFGYEAEGSPAT